MDQSKTMKDLMDAFAGESMANRKYLAYAAQADKEGYPAVAKLLKTIAEAETLHAHSHFRVAGGVGDTMKNLQAALDGETYEFSEMYPGFMKDAEAEGNKAAFKSFQLANEAEKVHAELYKKAIANLEKGRDAEYYLCPFCGYVQENGVPDECPICKAKGSTFKKIA